MLVAAYTYSDPMFTKPSVNQLSVNADDVKSVPPSSPRSQLSKPVRPLTGYREFSRCVIVLLCSNLVN